MFSFGPSWSQSWVCRFEEFHSLIIIMVLVWHSKPWRDKVGPAHGRFAFEGEPWMSLFEKNIYVGRIIASKRALGSVVRYKRRVVLQIFLCLWQFPERCKGVFTEKRLKRSCSYKWNNPETVHPGREPGPECKGEFGLGVPSSSGHWDFPFRVIGPFGSPLSGCSVFMVFVLSLNGTGNLVWTVDMMGNITVDRLSDINHLVSQNQGEKPSAFKWNVFQLLQQKMYGQWCNKSNTCCSYSWDLATGSVSFSKNVFFFFSRTWGYFY